MIVKARLWKGKIAAQIPYELKNEVTCRRTIMGYKFVQAEKPYWEMPYSPFTAMLLNSFEQKGVSVEYVDKEIPELYQSYLKALKARSSTDLPMHLPRIKEVNPKDGTELKPWLHQRQAYWFCKDLPGCMLAFDMGTGKSLTAVALTVNTKHDRVIIVCPKSVIPVWPEEFKYAIKDNFMFYAAEGRKSVKAKADQLKTLVASAERNRQPFVFIVNYDAFWREEMKKVLLNYDWDVLIADESHRGKNPGNSARASRFLTRLARQCGKRIGLTGTPFPHSPLDIFAQYRALDPAIYGENYHRFKMLYAELGGFGGKQIIAYKNMDELSAKFKSIAVQASKDVLDLPEFTHTYRSCELSPKARKIYQALDKQLFAEIEEGTCSPANAMVKVLRLQQLTSGYVALDDTERLAEVDTGKRDLLKDILEDLPHDEPVIVFCRFTADIRNVRKVADDLKRPVSELSGKRNELKAWQDGKTAILAVQIRSGGVGIDLTRAAYCVYYSVGHSLGDYLQSLDRPHRYGQKRNVTYFHLLAEDTIDKKVYQALMQKKDIIDSILKREV